MGLIIPPGENLVTYYMLPLLGLNKSSFGSSFKTSYIDKEGSKIYVELSKNMKVPSYKYNGFYVAELVVEGNLMIMFNIPASMAGDARMFIEGRYSEMSKEAKNIIYNTSTLPYNKNMGSFKNTDPILQALDKTRTLRVWLQSRLGLKELPESSELITKPLNDWFIEYRLKKHV